jgi:hypothetical protein
MKNLFGFSSKVRLLAFPLGPPKLFQMLRLWRVIGRAAKVAAS